MQSADYTKIINEFHVKRLSQLIKDKHGGEIVLGGNTDADNRLVEPTVILNPDYDSKIMKEEIFGPITPIKSYHSIDDLIEYINHQPKPLSL